MYYAAGREGRKGGTCTSDEMICVTYDTVRPFSQTPFKCEREGETEIEKRLRITSDMPVKCAR